MKSLNKIWNTIKDFHLIKYEIINGTIESHKFELLMKFDGIIQKGKTMTINDLAKIVNNLSNTVNGLAITVNGLAVEMHEGFKRVDEKFSDMKQYIDTRFAEVDEKIDDVKHELKNEMNTRFDKIEQRLDDHDAIFKRNNLE